MTIWKTVFGIVETPDILQEIEKDLIELNRRLMKAGKIEFDEYEEVK